MIVAVDLDGTLLRSDGTLSARTAEVLAAAQAAGVRVVPVTARPPRTVDILLGGAGFTGMVLCSNGAIRYDLATRKADVVGALPVERARETAAAIAELLPHAAFALETGEVVLGEPAYRKMSSFENAHVTAESRDHMWASADTIVKLLVWLPDDDIDAVLPTLQHLPGVHVTHSGGRGMLEISLSGVDKARALADLCAAYGVSSSDVAAFGDMPNDLPMLRWAGQAYAMANAHPLVLAEITGRAPANDEDGVAAILGELLANRHIVEG